MPNPSEIERRIETLRSDLEELREECEKEPTGSLIAQIERTESELRELTQC